MSIFAENLLKGKTILITGGATGLGRAMAIAFGNLGAKIGIVSRKKENLESTTAALSTMGIEIDYQVCDVRDRYSIYPEELTIWTVAMEAICTYERLHKIVT